MLDVGLFTFTESHIVKMLKICWFFPIQRCKMQICIQNMYFSLLLWNRCYLLSERLFQHFFFILQYCIKGQVPWVKKLTWKIFLGVSSKFCTKNENCLRHFFQNQNKHRIIIYSDQLPRQYLNWRDLTFRYKFVFANGYYKLGNKRSMHCKYEFAFWICIFCIETPRVHLG